MRTLMRANFEHFTSSTESTRFRNLFYIIDATDDDESKAFHGLIEKVRETFDFKTIKLYGKIIKSETENPNQKEAESKRLETMMKEVKEAEVNIEKKIQAEVGIYLGNKEEKERKKQNLIIQRLTETEEKEEDQKKKDKEEVLKIIEITNPEMISEVDNILKVEKNIIRLGRKKSDRPRPIRIILNDEEMKRDILKKCKNLRDSSYKHISVQDDLTREEQEKQYKLRQELRKRKEEGQKVRIYRGEIIPVDQHPGNSD